MSRRRMLAGAGIAGATLAAGTLAGATAAGAASAGPIPPGTTVFEFVSRISQDGTAFSGLGYLTEVAGMSPDELFADPSNRNETTALVVSVATGMLVGRSVDGVVHALDIEGDLSVYRRSGPGAAWSDPGSFSGDLVARYSLDLQDVLTVIAPQTGLPVLNGTARQVRAGDLRGRTFGRAGQNLRFTATGFGTRSDPGTASPQAQLTIAGQLSAV